MKYCLFLILLLPSCIKRAQIEADIWKVDETGVFRIVNCTKKAESEHLCEQSPDCSDLSKEQCDKLKTYEEFVSWKNPTINTFMAMRREDAQKWLDEVEKKKE